MLTLYVQSNFIFGSTVIYGKEQTLSHGFHEFTRTVRTDVIIRVNPWRKFFATLVYPDQNGRALFIYSVASEFP
jgi:hypothetical protein